MTDTQTLQAVEASDLPVVVNGNDELIVEQQTISPRLKAYIELLAKGEPVRQLDITVARHRVVEELKPRWPKHPGWEKEEQQVLTAINETVQSMATLGPTTNILLRITIGSVPLLPAALMEPNEAVAVVAFDSVQGTRRQCTIAAHDPSAMQNGDSHAGA